MKTYHLHFIGSQYYTRESFEYESIKYGIQRAIPFHLLKNLSFDENILLANYIKPNSAEVFGILNFNRIVTTMSPDYIKKAFATPIGNIDVTETTFKRVCGSYENEMLIYDVDKTVQELYESIINSLILKWQHNDKIEVTGDNSIICTCKKCNNKTHDTHVCIDNHHKCCIIPHTKISPNIFKWFIGGSYYKLPFPFKVSPIKFTRSITKIEVDTKKIKLPSPKNLVYYLQFIKKYKKRGYMSRFQRNNFNKIHHNLNSWFETEVTQK